MLNCSQSTIYNTTSPKRFKPDFCSPEAAWLSWPKFIRPKKRCFATHRSVENLAFRHLLGAILQLHFRKGFWDTIRTSSGGPGFVYTRSTVWKYSGRWIQICRHEFVQMNWLREIGHCAEENLIKSKPTYQHGVWNHVFLGILKVPQEDKCSYCSHAYRAQLECRGGDDYYGQKCSHLNYMQFSVTEMYSCGLSPSRLAIFYLQK